MKRACRRLAPMLALLLAACGSQAPRPVIDRAEAPAITVPPEPTFQSVPKKATGSGAVLKRGGGFYKDDGPGDNVPENIDAIPDAVPKAEPLHRFANNPYSVFGRDYLPQRAVAPFRQRGVGSWYGRKFHGQKTSSGEPYDMYGMTAAHPTLPIPSYVRVTNPANGASVVVRINDRGPFHGGRIIDLSWTAAYKLGYITQGSTLVEVETIVPGQTAVAAAAPDSDPRPDPIARLLAEPEARPLPQSTDARGHFLQLGAFGNRDNAEALLAHLSRELGDSGLSDKLLIQASGPLHRVQLGPFATQSEARTAGEKLRESFGLAPVIVQR